MIDRLFRLPERVRARPRHRDALRRGRSACALVALLLLAPAVVADDTDGWSIGPRPAWVEPIEAFGAAPSPRMESERPRGIDVRLFERQIDLRDSGTVSWYATERAFLTRDGVADHARHEIVFDPLYERVTLHEVLLLRNDRVLDRLQGLDVRVLDTEPERRAGLYHGRRTLSLLIEDVRVGDVLRVAFTRAGNNPILAGLREHGFSTERTWKTEGRARLRVLADANSALHVRTEGPAPEPVEAVSGGVRELVLDQASTPARPFPESVPPRARDHGRVVVSDVADWGEVVDWARTLYALDGEMSPELDRVATRIAERYENRAARIGAALRWVQDEIRYFAVSLGADSHRPATPAQTLRRRFGDCKGKTLLLIALLDRLGVESHPALVNTDGEIEAPDHPWRLHAFDHVIVRVVEDGTSHWLDPTLSHARGALGDLFEPDYGVALVLAEGIEALEPMTSERKAPPVVTEKRLEVADAATTLEIRTRLPAARARNLRGRIERGGLRALDESYHDYYDDLLDGAERVRPLERRELEDGGLEIVERYTTTLWSGNDAEVRRRTLDFSELDDEFVFVPDDHEDDAPFLIGDSRPHVERWTIVSPRRIEVEDADRDRTTPWFRFRRTSEIDPAGTTAVVTARFEPLVDEVAAADLDAYREALDDAWQATRFTVVDRPPTGPVERFARALAGDPDEASALEIGALAAGIGAIGVAVARRRREHRRRTRAGPTTSFSSGTDAPGRERNALLANAAASPSRPVFRDPGRPVVSREYAPAVGLTRRAVYRLHRTLARPLLRSLVALLLLTVAVIALDHVSGDDGEFVRTWLSMSGAILGLGALLVAANLIAVERGLRKLAKSDVRYRFELDANRFSERGSDGSAVQLELADLHSTHVHADWILLQENGRRCHVLPRTAFASGADWDRAAAFLGSRAGDRAGPGPVATEGMTAVPNG